MIIANKESNMELDCSPTVADIDGDNRPEIVFGFGSMNIIYSSRDTATNIENPDSGYYAIGNITAVSFNGSLPGKKDNKNNFVSIWPFTTSTPVTSSLLINDIDSDGILDMYGISSGGWIYAWKLDETQGRQAKVLWNGGYGNMQRTSVYADSLLPPEPDNDSSPIEIKVLYCYPNPVVNKNSVMLRYRLNRRPDNIEIILYDSNGDFIDSFSDISGNDSWNHYALNISDYPSGVYRAKLIVKEGAVRRVKFCKIAVVR